MSESLPSLLGRIRGVAGLTLREVEKRTGISNAYLSQLESGTALRPSPHILHKLATLYGVPYESLMEAAGYLDRPLREKGSSRKKRVSALSSALLSASLSEEDEAKVADFIGYLRSKRERT